MDTLGSLGFGALITLAVIWALGVRVKLDAGSHTVLSALFFVVAAIALGLSGADRLHSLWLIPTGFVFAIAMAYVAAHLPLLFKPLLFLATVFASVVRIGIPAHRIKAAQEAGLRATIDEWANKTERERKGDT
jgi:hypothetical protein